MWIEKIRGRPETTGSRCEDGYQTDRGALSQENHSFPIRMIEVNASFKPLKGDLYSIAAEPAYGKKPARAEKSNYWKSVTIYNANERQIASIEPTGNINFHSVNTSYVKSKSLNGMGQTLQHLDLFYKDRKYMQKVESNQMHE